MTDPAAPPTAPPAAPPDVPRPQPRATGWRLHTPNALVVLRLILTAAVVAILAEWPILNEAFYEETLGLAGWMYLAAALFTAAALTDALDGYLARRWNAITTFGRIMDPLADKLLVLGTFVMLAGWVIPPWIVVIILARELMVTSLRAYAEAQGLDFSASAVGKAKMVVQSVGLPLIMILVGVEASRTEATASIIESVDWASLTPVEVAAFAKSLDAPDLVSAVTSAVVLAIALVTTWSLIPYLFNAYDAFTGGRYLPKPTNPLERAKHSAARALTVHGFGLLRPFPGTWGSLPPVLLAAALAAAGFAQLDASPARQIIYYAVLATICLWGCWACLAKGHIAEAIFAKKDPGQVVADEVAGMCITLIALPITLDQPWWAQALWLAGAFLAFRFFDIVKLPPAAQLQKLPGGLGILIDDLAAGVYALITLQVINLII